MANFAGRNALNRETLEDVPDAYIPTNRRNRNSAAGGRLVLSGTIPAADLHGVEGRQIHVREVRRQGARGHVARERAL